MGVAVEVSSMGTAAAAGTGDPGAVSTGAAAALGGVAGLGGGAAGLGGAGLSGLMPPSQAGPEYMFAVKPFVFHFSSKSAAALFGVSPRPMTLFQG